jgi:hypothetical protein
MNVSEACASSGDDMIYKMKPLSFEDSEILFHRRIFQSEEKCPHDLLVVSTEILKKCGGVPLAIITIASLLASKQEINEKDEWSHLLASIGRGVTEDAILKDMKRILSLSYYDLSSHLKSCLLYLSIFPEDFMIEKDWLIWMWIAEGFIQCDKEESRLFKIGEHYFNELINRSLIQPTLINGEGMVVACQIHDMVLDLICSLSAEEKFVSILDRAERHASNLQWKVRRLSLHNSKAKFPNHRFDITSLSKLRSFVVFSPATCDWLPSLSSLQFLRVLDLGNCGGHESISCISLKYVGNLLHLRYLGLKNADVHELPVDIGKLQLLQTIDIEGTRIEKLPASVVHLTHLKCLSVDKRTRLPKGMGLLTSLEVLKGVNISLSPHIVKELSELTKVWMLSIDWSKMDVDLTNVLIKSLGNLLKLQILEIWNGCRLIDLMREGWMLPPHLHKFESWGNWSKCADLFLSLPKWINPTSLPVLSSLIIDVEELQGGDIQIIGILPALRFLWLGAVRVMGKLVVGADAFTSARECRFKGFPVTPCLFPPGAMPRLQRLRFEVSAQLIASGEVDCAMAHLPLLELVWAMLQDDNSSYEQIGKAKAVLRGAANAHPKHPIMVIIL